VAHPSDQFLGHGICDVTNKTAPIAGSGGRATADSDIIGDCAWRLLKGMHFDPKELRGIGIHVQKLEKVLDAANAPTTAGQSALTFKKTGDDTKELPTTPPRKELLHPVITVESPLQDGAVEDPTVSSSGNRHLKPDSAMHALPSFSQVDPSFLEALPADIRAELELEYKRANSGQAVAGPSRLPDADPTTVNKPPSVTNQEKQPPADIALMTRQLAPKSRPSVSATKRIHPLFAKRTAPNVLKVGPAELKLLNIDADVWDELPIELQREQLAALRAANVGTGMAIRASMSTQAKQERILHRWRARRSSSVGIRGQRLEIYAKALELPGLKQRGNRNSEELRVSETEDIQAVLSQWIQGFEEDGPRQGDVEYFGKFLERCVETDVGAEKGVSALKWWRILLRQRWSDMEREPKPDDQATGARTLEAGRAWWNAFWEVKTRMDGVVRKRYGGCLSVK
jgi:DNA repair protein REV1